MKWELKLFITRAIKEGYDGWWIGEVKEREGGRMEGFFEFFGGFGYTIYIGLHVALVSR